MFLHEEGDGILKTHVTWDDIQKDLQKAFSTSATFGDNKVATNISDMKGYMSIIALIDPDWQGVEPEKELPARFAVKISSQLPIVTLSKIMKYEGEDGFGEEKLKKLSKLTRHCHNREVGSYQLLERFNHPDIPRTKTFALKRFESDDDVKGYLIVDYIPNVHALGPLKYISADDLKPVIRGVATFSALIESIPAEEKKFAGGSDYLDLVFEQFLDDAALEKSYEGLRQAFGEEHKKKMDELIEIFRHYRKISKKFSKLPELIGFKLVMSHGDLWQSNFLHTLDENGKLNLEAIIDWQGLATLPTGMDTSRLFFGCLSNQDRRERGKELLELYHQTYCDVLGEEAFPFQQMQDCYTLYVPYAAILIIPSLMPFLEASSLPEEEKAEVQRETFSRMLGMMDEVFEAHQYNLEHYPDLLRA